MLTAQGEKRNVMLDIRHARAVRREVFSAKVMRPSYFAPRAMLALV